MANHLTPTELAEEAGMDRREVISKCMEMGVPIFQGRIDKTLFLASLRESQGQPQVGLAASGIPQLPGTGGASVPESAAQGPVRGMALGYNRAVFPAGMRVPRWPSR